MYYGTDGYWYKDGIFYQLDDTHVDFLLENPDLLGVTQEEIEAMFKEKGREVQKSLPETDELRADLCILAMKKGAVRIRCYREGASAQIFDRKSPKCAKALADCLMDNKANKKGILGDVYTIMDTKGWGMRINDILDFLPGTKAAINELLTESKDKKAGHENNVVKSYKERRS